MASQVFISHITEDSGVAARLKLRMTEDFLGQVTVFLSSDTESIAAGEEWLASVSNAIRNSSIFIVLCSPIAIRACCSIASSCTDHHPPVTEPARLLRGGHARLLRATGTDIADLGEEHRHRVLRVCGKGIKTGLVPLPPAVGRAIDRTAGCASLGCAGPDHAAPVSTDCMY